jgi:hypothetical protein
MTHPQALTEQILADHLEPIARFASESFLLHGRGCVFVEFPDVPPGTTVAGLIQMVYHQLADVPRLDGNEDAAILIRMIETYNPAEQAVVTAAIEGQLPISVKMKLVRPVIADEPPAVA